ncbi:MAG: DUF4198 domain-containing protein [Campylobacteraceae bacterium]|jgi:hypothetical protein|nr:DUF4198 domain-containing protein [Campylobacteraceae bacterium]
MKSNLAVTFDLFKLPKESRAKQKTLSQILRAVIAPFVICTAVQAHQIWLEQDGENSVVRFGEFGDNLRETSPGLLDNFGAVEAKLFSKDKLKPLTSTKSATGFVIPVRLASGESLTAEDARFPIRTFKREGREIRSLYYPSARFITDFSALTPSLTLDITPIGKQGAFKVTFKNKPLARTEVQILVQSGWSKKAYTNSEGEVTFDLPWQGQYVVEVSHADSVPGERGEEKYDGINYVTTLTLVQPTGVAPLPAVLAAKPNVKK